MKFPVEALTQHVAIVGKTGSGKTYAAKGLVEQLLEAKKRVCVIDPLGVWYGLRSSADGKKPGFAIAVFGGEHGDVQIAPTSGPALAKVLGEKNLPAIIDLSEMLIGDRHRFMTEFSDAIYRENRDPLELVIDEADEFVPQNPLPETRRMLHHVDRIIRRGRVKGFRVMMITQRPAVIHKNALTQANTLVVMRLTGPQDRKAVEAWIEGNGSDGDGKRVLQSLASLNRGEGWVWAPEMQILERMQFPKIQTFDSSRTPDENQRAIAPTKLADVDLGEIRQAFLTVAEEAKTMIELKAEVSRLQRELAAAQRKASNPAPARAQATQPAGVTVHIPNIDAVAKAIQKATAEVTKRILVDAFKPKPAGSRTALPSAATTPARGVPLAPRPAAAVASAADPAGSARSGSQQKILNALAWFAAVGVEAPRRSPLAAVADTSPKSSGFEKNLSTLRTLGLIDYEVGSRVKLTDAGDLEAFHPAKNPTQADLHEMVCRMVSGPQAHLLRILLGQGRGRSLSREDLALAANVSAASSGFEKNISTLKSFELVEYPERGLVRAADMLFI